MITRPPQRVRTVYHYLVGPVGYGQFQTVQAAIDQAVTDGASLVNPKDIGIYPGSFAESLSIPEGINLHAVKQYPQRLYQGALSVEIQGVITVAPTVSNHTLPTTITGVRVIGPTGSSPIKFLTTLFSKSIIFNGCYVVSDGADTIDFGPPVSPNLHRVHGYKTVMTAGVGAYNVAKIPAQASIDLRESTASGGFIFPGFAWTPSFVLEDGGITAHKTDMSGQIVTNAGFSSNFIWLEDCGVGPYSAGDPDLILNGALSTGVVARTYGHNGRVLVLSGAQAADLQERPIASAGEVLQYDGSQWLPTAGVRSKHTLGNKNMIARNTTSDGDLGVNQALVDTPSADGYIMVIVGMEELTVADGTGEQATKMSYFSGNGGTTARAIADIQAGDTWHFNGSVAGYQLDTNDRVHFHYEKAA